MLYLIDDVDATVERILLDKELVSCGLNKEKVIKTLESFEGDEIACSVFYKKYALRDDDNQIIEFTLDEAKTRWAIVICEAEKGFDKQFEKDVNYFKELYNYFLPGGRQMFALGNKAVKKASYTNCYVTEVEEDSLEGIFDTAKKIAKTYSYGGGIGFCLGKLRPKQAAVSNTAKYSTGSVSFMELYSMTTGLIGQSGRRGALLLSMPIDHPDIEDFIEIKHNNKDKIRYANISVKITDEFMNAVINDTDFELKFETKHEKIRKIIRARDLWEKLILSARDSAEPGLLFWDRITQQSPTDTYEEMKVVCTNPCGELPLGPTGATCVLGSLLLPTFVLKPYTEQASFDFDIFSKMIYRAVRHLDNVVELNFAKHPLKEQEHASKISRRIGLGITGLADLFVAMNIKYDTQKAIDLAEKIMYFKMCKEYKATIELAKERGAFPLFDAIKHYERGFCKGLPEEIKEFGKKFGQRNAGLSTVAPNGSVSIIAQCSSGIEPIFALSYRRFVEMGDKEKKEYIIRHQGYTRFLNGDNKDDKLLVVAHQVDSKFRIKMQATIQKYTDASISSTINLPKETTAEMVGNIYIDAWKNGLKGITVYREGSREGVLITEEDYNNTRSIDMNTIINCVTAEGGDKFYIMISYQNSDITKPYQVFVLNYKQADRDSFIKISNALIKMLKAEGVEESRIEKYLERSKDSLGRMTRFLSLSMKTGSMEKAIQILNEYAFAGTLASRLYEILSRSLVVKKAVCKNCRSSNVRMEEGCIICLDCNTSGCGG